MVKLNTETYYYLGANKAFQRTEPCILLELILASLLGIKCASIQCLALLPGAGNGEGCVYCSMVILYVHYKENGGRFMRLLLPLP